MIVTPAVAEERFRALLADIAAGADPEPVLDELKTMRRLAPIRTRKLRKLALPALWSFGSRILSDDVVDHREAAALDGLADALGVELPHELAKKALIAAANGGYLPELSNPRLVTKPGEAVHLQLPASLLKEVVHREYRGASSGVSFRVVKGVRFHTGSTRGRSVVVGTTLEPEDTGTLSITSSRAIFLGVRKTIDLPYKKLANLTVYSDGLQFHQENRVNAPLFRGFDGEIAAAFLNEAMQRTLAPAAAPAAVPPARMITEPDTKACPDCAETIKAAARVCRFCGYRFEA